MQVVSKSARRTGLNLALQDELQADDDGSNETAPAPSRSTVKKLKVSQAMAEYAAMPTDDRENSGDQDGDLDRATHEVVGVDTHAATPPAVMLASIGGAGAGAGAGASASADAGVGGDAVDSSICIAATTMMAVQEPDAGTTKQVSTHAHARSPEP